MNDTNIAQPPVGPRLSAWAPPFPVNGVGDVSRSVPNRLLAALPRETCHRLLPWLEPVKMPLGQQLWEPGGSLRYVYFPTTSVVAHMHALENGSTAGTALVGSEGMVGTALFTGGRAPQSQAEVFSAGQGFRLSASALLKEFELAGDTTRLLLRFTQALITQLAQTAACNRHHTLDQRLCRLLLLILDRTAGTAIVTTHDRLANMLGVRREGVTEAVLQLHRDGIAMHARSRITVLDRARLELRACECYAVVEREYSRLLPAIAPAAVGQYLSVPSEAAPMWM